MAGRWRFTISGSNSQRCTAMMLLIMISVALALLRLLLSSSTTNTSVFDVPTSGNEVESSSLHREALDGVNVLWMRPRKAYAGLLFVAHGCHHANTDWFPADNTVCPDCIGLPEERAIIEIAMQLNLAVLAISSTDRMTGCWSAAADNEMVIRAIQAWKKKYHDKEAQKLPIYAFGASSGGSFVAQLGLAMKESTGSDDIQLHAALIQIAVGRPNEPSRNADCTVYISMNRDTRTDGRIQTILQQQKGNVKQIRLPPLAVESDYFSSRILSISSQQSSQMVQALRNSGWIESTTRLLQHDPRSGDWRSVLRPFAGKDSFVADQSAVSEVMNVAFGMHELSRDGVKEALNHCSSGLDLSP